MSSSRMKWMVAVPLAALFATGCTDDVTQEESGTFVRATFDPSRSLIPTPNDLALQAAASIDPVGASSPVRAALMGLINAGGFVPTPSLNPADPGSLSVINIPYEFIVDGVGTTATGTAAIDVATVTTTTLAIVKVTGGPTLIDPLPVGTRNSALQVLPDFNGNRIPDDSWEADTRYVVAMRGGPNGVKTLDGRTISASTPIFLIVNGTNLSDPDTRPSSITPEQAADLQKVQGLLANPVDWDKLTSAAACSLVLGAPAQAFPENLCWVPLLPGVPGAPGTVPSRSALAAVGLAFPVTEAASIQVFETAP